MKHKKKKSEISVYIPIEFSKRRELYSAIKQKHFRRIDKIMGRRLTYRERQQLEAKMLKEMKDDMGFLSGIAY